MKEKEQMGDGVFLRCNKCHKSAVIPVDRNITRIVNEFSEHHKDTSLKVITMPIIYYDRNMFRYLNYHKGNKSLVGVEIGAMYGYNAKNIFNMFNIEKLYLIDPYLDYDVLTDDTWKYTNPMDVKKICKKLLKPYEDRIQYIEKYGHDAVDDIPNNLDFVYTDANHSYEFVKRDLELYYPKIKKGGVIGGHDFSTHHHIEVIEAFIDFIRENDIKKTCADIRNEGIDFWIVK